MKPPSTSYDRTESQYALRGGGVQLANGSDAETSGTMTAWVVIGKRRSLYTFGILPAMEDQVLMGVDLLAKLSLGIPPPPLVNQELRQKCNTAKGLTEGSEEERKKLKNFLEHELRKFDGIQGPTDKAQHVIRLTDPVPIKQRYWPRNPAMQAVINDEVDDILRQGVIEPSHSPWSSPVVVLRKKDGKFRFCIDFRKVNNVTCKDAYPLPQVIATLDKLRGARYLSTLDLKNGYWQISLSPESRPITAFTVPGKGLFQFRVMLSDCIRHQQHSNDYSTRYWRPISNRMCSYISMISLSSVEYSTSI